MRGCGWKIPSGFNQNLRHVLAARRFMPCALCAWQISPALSADDAVRAASKSPQLFTARLKITQHTLIKIHAAAPAFSLQNTL
jgi:hypothetical protein